MAQVPVVILQALQTAKDAYDAAVARLNIGATLDPTNDDAAVSGRAVGDYILAARDVQLVYQDSTDIINVDFDNNLIEFPATFYISYGNTSANSLEIFNGQADITIGGSGTQFLIFNSSDQTLSVLGFSDGSEWWKDPAKKILMGFYKSNQSVVAPFDFLVNGKPDLSQQRYQRDISVIFEDPQGVIDIDFEAEKVKFPSRFLILGVQSGTFKFFENLSPIDFINNSVHALVFNARSEAIRLEGSTYDTSDPEDTIIVTFWPSEGTIDTRHKGILKDGLPYKRFNFNETKQRMILPDTLYLSGLDQTIYKDNLTPIRKNLEAFRLGLSDMNGTALRIETSTIINRTILTGVAAEFRQIINDDFSKYFYKRLNLESVDESGLAPVTHRFLAIGDSLTDQNMTAEIKAVVEANSALTLDCIGTNDQGGGVFDEGRSSWEFSDFIGKSTNQGDSPFMKLADVDDKTNHPEWCFTDTGSENETSYAEDDSLGDYYIFDFDYYLSNNGLSVPDTVTIALSTNDYNTDYGTWLEDCRLGIEIILKQINQYCADSATSINVAVIPAPAWAMNDERNSSWEEICEWIEYSLSDINSYALPNIDGDMLAVYLFQDPMQIYGMNAGSNINSISTVKESTISDDIHWENGPSESGKIQYATAVSSYIFNKI